MDDLPARILDFWFGPPPRAQRPEWFRKDDRFDATIRERFDEAIGIARAGGYGEWCATPPGALARILLLDQFTRNVHRGTALAFAGDARALATAQQAVAAGFDRGYDFYERWFCYLPFEHSEDLAMQERSLALMRKLSEDMGDPGPFDWAEKHAVVVRRFGRYPHRNAILGRPSTPEELAFLAQPGSSF
jgi:uncharacterized protein (DUF924 family)